MFAKLQFSVSLCLLHVVGCFLACALAEDAAQPLASVSVDVYQLKHWGERKFDIYLAKIRKTRVEDTAITERELEYMGTHNYSTQVNDDGVVLRQYWVEPSLKRGGAIVTYHCRKDALLTLARMEVFRDTKTTLVDVTDNAFELDFMGKTRSGVFPADTVTDASLLRLVTLLPRTPGKSYTVGHRTNTPEINILGGEQNTVHCLGTETVVIREREMECTKFQCGTALYWVRNSDSMLVRHEVPGWKIMELNETTR
jgi:hypothetical protein